jgi:hypothetical protein
MTIIFNGLPVDAMRQGPQFVPYRYLFTLKITQNETGKDNADT